MDLAAEGIDVAVRGGRARPDTASLVAREVAIYRCFVVASETYLRVHGAPKTCVATLDRVIVEGV